MPITYGCTLPSRGSLASPEILMSLAQRAEDLGFDSIWVSDHVILPREVESFYPYAADGVPTFTPAQPYYDPIATLNFLAGCTEKLRLGTHVLILPYRNPVVTAKMLATLDVLSGGRLTLGIGVGWMEEEFKALGLDNFEQRGEVSNEYLQLFKELWTKDHPEFQGKHYQIEGPGFQPKPLQKPHPPIWVGGHTSPAIRRAAEFGDGWMPIGLRPPAILEPEELGDKISRLRDLTVKSGRPADAVALCFSTDVVFEESPPINRMMMRGLPEQVAADLRQYQDLGVNNFIISFPSDTAEGQRTAMERFSREVMPLIPTDI